MHFVNFANPDDRKTFYIYVLCHYPTSVLLFWVLCFRSHGKYCYKHLETGCVRWEYPGSEANGGIVHEGDSNSEDSSQCHLQNAVDDEMDICTTPPPNANEQLLLGTTGGSSKSKANFKPNTKVLVNLKEYHKHKIRFKNFYCFTLRNPLNRLTT